MAVIEKRIEIDAPVDAVFDFVDDPMHAADFGPGVDRVEVLRRTDERIGDSFRLIYSVLGIDFPVTFVSTGYERPRRLVARMEGPMSGEFRWDFREIDGGRSEAAVRIDYAVKGGAVGRAVDSILLERMNEKNAGQMVENLKQRVEQVRKLGA